MSEPVATRGRWRKAGKTVQKLSTFQNSRKKSRSQIELLEDQFCSKDTRRQLSQDNLFKQVQQAAFYTKPNAQAESLAHLPSISSKYNQLPPLTSRTVRMASFEDSNKAIQRRIKRRKSLLPSNGLPHQGSSIALTSAPRFFSEQEKRRLRMKFTGLVRVFMAFKRIWRFHKGRVDEILGTFKGLDTLVKPSADNSQLLFDVEHYKAKKQSVVSSEVKKILSKHPTMRTPEDIHTLIVFMGNYNSLAEYPMVMQRMIALKAWYEWYDAKRVITREGHVAYSFFHILSGSAVMTSFDQQSTESQTVKFIGRGDSFGDVCLLNGHARECTTISKEFIELLVLPDEDFIEIFMSGGLKKNKDTFLESLSFMEGWPTELLQSGTKRTLFTYFKKGTVIVKDSTKNEWIYIVKSGSCSVMKKLKDTELNEIDLQLISGKRCTVKESLVDKMDPSIDYSKDKERSAVVHKMEAELNHEASSKDELAYYDPDIHIPLNGLLDEVKSTARKRMLPPINKNRKSVPKDGEAKYLDKSIRKLKLGNRKSRRFKHKKTSAFQPRLEDVVEEEEAHTCSEDEKTPEEMEVSEKTPEEMEVSKDSVKKMVKKQAMKDPSKKLSSSDVFITVQHLKSGSHFGLIEAIADTNFVHPSLSLVSHGAECVVMHRKLFLDHAPLKLLDKLREQLFPYPSDERLQENLEVSIYWNKHKQTVIDSQLAALKTRHAVTY